MLSSVAFRAGAALGFVAMTACAHREFGLDATLADGSTIAQLVHDEASLIVIDPGDCFSCSVRLARWVEMAELEPHRMVFVLTRPPSEDERLRLAHLRIAVSGVIAKQFRAQFEGADTPVAYQRRSDMLVLANEP